MIPDLTPTAFVPGVLVGVGGAAGAIARYLVAKRASSPGRATLTVNVLGSFALGALTAGQIGDPVTLALAVGFCGAFTTFSSFAVETTDTLTSAGPLSAGRVALLHLVGALLAVALGGLLGAVVL